MVRPILALLAATAIAGGCGADDDPDRVAFSVAGDNPVDDTLWCEPDDIVADLTSTTAFPPTIEVPALGETEADQKPEAFVGMLFAGAPAANAGRRLDHPGGPVATVALSWPETESDDPQFGGWLTFRLVDGDWTVTGYTACNRFAFGD